MTLYSVATNKFFIYIYNMANKNSLVIMLIFAVYLLVGVFIFRDYGIPWDERIQQNYGVDVVNLVLGKSNKPLDKVDKWYGPVFEVSLVFLQNIFKLTDSRQIYLSRHLFTFLSFYIGAIFFFLILRKRFGTKYSILGSLLLILNPRIFAHSFYNSKDTVFLSFFIIAIFFFQKYLESKNIKNLVIFAFASAIAVNIRIIGVIIPFFFFIFFVLEKLNTGSIKNNLKQYALYLLLTYAFTVLMWPTLWENPIKNLILAFKYYPQDTKMLFFGKEIVSTNVPWNYALGWLAVTTPITYLFLFFLGIFHLLKARKNDVLFFLWFFVPLFVVMVLKSIMYDEWRQLYFIYPALVYICIFGIYNCSRYYRIVIFPAIILEITLTVFLIIQYHPFQNVYFNIFAGDRKNLHKKFDLDYWGISYKKGLEFIVSSDQKNEIKVKVLNFPGKNNLLILMGKDRNRINISQKHKIYDYYVTNYRNETNILDEKNLVYSVNVDKVRILGVYKY